MYELLSERQLVSHTPAGMYDDYDYDVDVYLWYPSMRSTFIAPAAVENGFELPSVFERLADDQLDEDWRDLPPLSPSQFSCSTLDFPTQEGSERTMHKNSFRSRLILVVSQDITRRIDGWLRTLRKHLGRTFQRPGAE